MSRRTWVEAGSGSGSPITSTSCKKLPPRMRALTDEEKGKQMARIGMSRRRWEAYLRTECEGLNIPFMPYKRPGQAWAIGALLSDKQLRAFGNLGYTSSY